MEKTGMYKTLTKSIIVFMICLINSFCWGPLPVDARGHYIHRHFTSTCFCIIDYKDKNNDYPHWKTDEFISECIENEISIDGLMDRCREFEYNYINKYMFEIKAITKFNYGSGYSVFYINPDGAFWADNIADESDSIEDIQWEKVNHQIIRIYPIKGGYGIAMPINLPKLDWHDN